MHFSTLLPLCLAASTLANPVANADPKKNGKAAAVPEDVKANVTGQINQWLKDISTVNNFVDSVGLSNDETVIKAMAGVAFKAAQDEGVSNTVLSQAVTLDAKGKAASQALLAQFNIIGPAINDTITNPQNFKKNVDAINGARCPPPQGNGAIGLEGDVQASAAKAAGVSVSPPELPKACSGGKQADAPANGTCKDEGKGKRKKESNN